MYRADIIFDRNKEGELVSRGYGFIQFRNADAMKHFRDKIAVP